MIRPEIRAAAIRWRDALAGGAAALAGLWLMAGPGGLPGLFGLALLLAGGFLVVSGLRRGRFRAGAAGPGILRTDEGRIAYMGPVTGGTVSLDDLAQVALERAPDGTQTWHLSPEGGATLLVPAGAAGAEALPDALAPLPGFDGGHMIAAVQARKPGLRVVWRRQARTTLT